MCLRFQERFPFNVLKRSPVARRIPGLPEKSGVSRQPPRCLRVRGKEKLRAEITCLQPVSVLPLCCCQREQGLEHVPGCLPDLVGVRLCHMGERGVKLLPNRAIVDPPPSVWFVGVQRVVERASKGHEEGE